MTNYLGDFATGSTVYVYFDTFSGAGASVTMTGFAVTDIEIYKNGSTTQRSSDNGVTLLDTDGTDFDGITGIHGFSIDLSDNTDSGFYAAGNDYTVVVSSVTIDGQTVSFIAARFSIQNRSNTLLATQTSVDTIDDFLDTEIAAIKAKTDNLPSDPADASDISSAFSTVNATLATLGGYIDTEVAAIKAKTDNLPSDPADASDIAALIDALPTAAENATAVLTTAMTESYNTDGSTATVAQALYGILQRLTEFSISGTTITVKKLDGSTTAMTLTLDSATTPTSSTRAS